jgi:hypothetical protein
MSADAIDDKQRRCIKKGTWIYIDPPSASCRGLGKNTRSGYTDGDVQYGPVEVQALHKFKDGVEIQFYVNTAAGKMSRVWWLGNDSGQARRADDQISCGTQPHRENFCTSLRHIYQLSVRD